MSVLTQLQKGGFSIGVLHLPPFPTSLRRDRWPLELSLIHISKNRLSTTLHSPPAAVQ